MSAFPQQLNGRCMCGAVAFAIQAPFRPILMCHCRQCARWTGSVLPATSVALERFSLLAGENDLAWYRVSGRADRGFCRACGSSLFWKPIGGSRISVLVGTLDPPTGLSIAAHVFVDDKSDYYEIVGDAPRFARDDGAPLET
jgi:hypothetical protein